MYICLVGMFCAVFLLSCLPSPDGECSENAEVAFRGHHFEFPITGKQAMEVTEGELDRYTRWWFAKKNQSSGQTVSWYTDPENSKKYTSLEGDQYMDRIKMFAVGFKCRKPDPNNEYGSPCQSVEEVMTELKKSYPGTYEFVKINFESSYYIQKRGCLTILYNIRHGEVAFLYGIDDTLLINKFVQNPSFLYRLYFMN